jgi:hypothetical protein
MPSLIPPSKGHPGLYCHAEKDLPKRCPAKEGSLKAIASRIFPRSSVAFGAVFSE